jgi:hypothetical protein
MHTFMVKCDTHAQMSSLKVPRHHNHGYVHAIVRVRLPSDVIAQILSYSNMKLQISGILWLNSQN